MLTSHPPGTRFYPSRRLARAAKRPWERVVHLGVFSNGSFGLAAPHGRQTMVVWACVPDLAPVYVCDGSVRGTCGHMHKTLDSAKRCLDRDSDGCASQGGYSDRSIYAIERGVMRPLDAHEERMLDALSGF